MRFAARTPLIFSVLIAGIVASAFYAARLGRRVWSPRVFAWRNFLRRPPEIEEQPGCPLSIVNPRYYSFASIGSSVGGVLRFDVTNRSGKVVHSYVCRHRSPEPGANGSYGSHPEGGLSPGSKTEGSVSARAYAPLTLSIDFVQFDNGDLWFPDPPRETVKPEGVEAGARAAARFLLRVFERDGAAAVLDVLPLIHAEVREPNPFVDRSVYGIHGFYCGVTNIGVRVRRAYAAGGAGAVGGILRMFAG